jgi:thiol-disulfide isomerase/thioredoxin
MISMTKRPTFLLLLASLVAGACLTASCRRSEPATGHVSSSAYKSIPSAPQAPEWMLKDLDGRPVSSADFAGKVVVIDFWATWCGPCISELPGYIALQRKLAPKGFTIVGLSLDEIPPGDIRKFVAEHGINYPVAIAGPEQIDAFGGFDGIPATFIIDREGKLRFKKLGAAPIEDLEAVAQSLL